MIEQIISLAKQLDSKDQNFHIEAQNLLKNFTYGNSLKEFNNELSSWIIEENIPTQLNVYNNFGQPPITLFNNGKFVIDLYIWLHSDTSIHTHSFRGAFKVLFGKSKQDTFEVLQKEQFFDDVVLNNIKINESKILNQGDTQIILRGDQFCHRVIHIDSPTITLCIRTIDDLDQPQWHQFENGLSIRKIELSEATYKSVFYFEYLLTQSHKMAKQFLNKFLLKNNVSITMNLFEEVLSGSLGISEEAIEFFHDAVHFKFKKDPWFKLYLDACAN